VNKDQLMKEINQRARNSMVSTLGMEINISDDHQVSGKMPVDKRTVQPLGLLHGGASVAFAETLGSYAANLHVDYPKEYCVGIEVNANHLKSVSGGYVHGAAKPVKLGKKIQVWEIRIIDDSDDLVCISRLTLAVLQKHD